jgi:hypothetical protein
LKKLLRVACLFVFAAPIPSFASGSSVRGGGKAVVCRDPSGSLKSIELLDLWEARALYGREIAKSDAPVAEQVHDAIERLRGVSLVSFDDVEGNEIREKATVDLLTEISQKFLSSYPKSDPQMRWLQGATLALTDDSFEEAWPSGCGVEQVVAYRMWANGGIATINRDLFDAMDFTNRAALLVHEAFYNQRSYAWSGKSSARSRRAVGYVFSGQSFDAMPNPALPHLSCESDRPGAASFTIFADGATGQLMGAVFSGYEERPIGYFPTKLEFGVRLGLKDLVSPKTMCQGEENSPPSLIAILGGAGPADFDRSGAVFSGCSEGKIQMYWTEDPFLYQQPSQMTAVKCVLKNVP